MASSSIAVVTDSTMSQNTANFHDLESDLSYQNLEDATPGTIIFSPQDLRPLTMKKSGGGATTCVESEYTMRKPTAAPIVRNSANTVPMTPAEVKAEELAVSIEKLKDVEGPIACQFCGKMMLSGKTLIQHMSIHAAFKPFQCQYCPKSFTRKVQLQGHLVIHGAEKQFECPVCHQRFSRRDCVKVHMRMHDKSKCAFCEVCHKSFLTVGALRIHMRIHRGEKPFKCHLCGKCFTQKNHLITHIKRHTNVKDVHFSKKLGPRMFKCEHCARSFIRLSDYERHVQWNHGAVADVNNITANNQDVLDDDSAVVVKAPREVMKERSRSYKKRRPPVMCTTSTQTDEDGGHIIIPRQYKSHFLVEHKTSGAPPSEPSETPRRLDEDMYDAYDDGMDRNYSSDEEDEAQRGEDEETPARVFKIETKTYTPQTSADLARDAAFDAIVKGTSNVDSKRTMLPTTSIEDGGHILPDSLDADQPNERVFIIQNEVDSYEPIVTASEVTHQPTLTASEVLPSPVTAHTVHSRLSTTTTITETRPDSNTSVPDLNSHLESDNFAELVQTSYNNMSKGSLMPESQQTKSIPYVIRPAITGIPTGKRGRPKTKRVGIKGAAQLRMIRQSMMSFISDVKGNKNNSQDSCLDNEEEEEEEDEEEELVEDPASGEEENEPELSSEAVKEQVMMSIEDNSSVQKRPQRKRQLIKHGKDFLCTNKACKLCKPGRAAVAKIQPGQIIPAETLVRADVKDNKMKKEENLSQLAKKGDKKVAEIVNLLEFGVKDLQELNLGSENSLRISTAGGAAATPVTNRVVQNLMEEEIFTANKSTPLDSVVSPPVDVQSFCIPTYSCKLCGREFRFEGKLHRHIEIVHQKKQIFTDDIKPGRGSRTFLASDIPTLESLTAGMIVPNYDDQVEVSAAEDSVSRQISSAEKMKPKNPEIEALRSEWDDDEDEDDDEDSDGDVRPTVSKPQPIFSSTSHVNALRQHVNVTAGYKIIGSQVAMPIVTRDIQPMVTTVTDAYSGGVVLNMNRLTGLLPKIEDKNDEIVTPGGQIQGSIVIDDNSLDGKCRKLLLKLFDRQLLADCGLDEDHVSVVLGRVLQHYGVKMIEDYGQGQYEVLKYNLWRLMEWKVTIEQMEEFYSENKTVEEMMDDIMNERVPLVPHDVITQARAEEQAAQQQQMSGEIVSHVIDGTENIIVEQPVSNEQVVMQATEHMIVEQSGGQHIVVQSINPVSSGSQQLVMQSVPVSSGSQQLVMQSVPVSNIPSQEQTQIVLEPHGVSADTAMLVQQVMNEHPHLAGVTQVVVAQDLSPEMLQGAHIVTIDPTTGQVLSQMSADQVMLSPDGSLLHSSGTAGGGSVVSIGSGVSQQQGLVVSQEQVVMLPQYAQQHARPAASGS